MDINAYIKRKSAKVRPQTTEEAIQKYGSLSEEQLMNEMFTLAAEERQRGDLTNEKLDDFYNQAKGMLTPEQAERMKELILQLKK
ncbi:MAG: hypothetical protein WC292_02690 [Clostridia bacterium]